MRARLQFEMNDEGVFRYDRAGELVESAHWDALARVAIRTTSDGPYRDDLFFMLIQDDDRGVAVPSEEASRLGLLVRLQQLEGFDNEAMIRAASSSGDAWFELWTRDPGGPSGA